jgi:4'-phosphopantetheinyl transferase
MNNSSEGVWLEKGASPVAADHPWVCVYLWLPIETRSDVVDRAVRSLPEEERHYLDTVPTRSRIEEFAVGRRLLRLLVEPLIEGPLRLRPSEHGKPRSEKAEERGVSFNLSHSGGHYLAGVSLHGDVGVDVEAADRYRREVAIRFFHPGETAAIDALPASRQAEAFARLWAIKEACSKALGGPLAPEMSLISVAPDAATGVAGDLVWSVLDLGPNCGAAVAVRGLRETARPGWLRRVPPEGLL